jgi:hypothetical protein
MHLHTTVKVWAAKEAIERVNALLTNDGEFGLTPPFDWVADGETRISD